jgi:hypothetical protein
VSTTLIAAVTAIYAFTAASFLLEGRPGMFVVFLGYAVANLGIIWDGWK